jgi:YHS domain-containing protein
MFLNTITTVLMLTLIVGQAFAESAIRGAKGGAAIDGYDTVAYFVKKAAVKGSPEYTYEWAGAKWFFSSMENRDLFAADPEKYAPQYGGHCAWGVANDYLSRKTYEDVWELYGGKLYLFPGQESRSSWLRRGPSWSIHWGDRNWPKLKARLEAE